MLQKKIFIEGMHCRSCELLLEEALQKVPGVTGVNAHHRKGMVLLEYGDRVPDDATVRQVVAETGYRVADQRVSSTFFSKELEVYVNLLFALGIAFVLFLILDRWGWLSLSLGGGELDVSRLSVVFLVGLTAGISTCAALVGGLVLGVAARYNVLHPELSLRQKFIPHVWFNGGRVIGFGILGALLGAAGEIVQSSIGFVALLTLAAGLVMLFLGLQLSGVFPRLKTLHFTFPKKLSRLVGLQKHPERQYSHMSAFVAGVLTFFLPCGFTQAVQLSVVALGDPLAGAFSMGVFALGTMPGLFALGSVGTAVKGTAKQFLFALIAIVLVGFGSWNIVGGMHLLGVNTLAFRGADNRTTGSIEQKTEKTGAVQVIRMTQDASGYHPNAFPALAVGVPVQLIVDSRDSYTCATSFVIPQFNIQKRLRPGENVIEFTPTKSGTIPFSCSMGMFRGALTVQ